MKKLIVTVVGAIVSGVITIWGDNVLFDVIGIGAVAVLVLYDIRADKSISLAKIQAAIETSQEVVDTLEEATGEIEEA